MPTREQLLKEAAKCRISKQHARGDDLHGKLQKFYKPKQLARLLDAEEARLRRAPA